LANLKIALLQASGEPNTVDQAFDKLNSALGNAASQDAHILTTPELYLSGYGDREATLASAQDIDSPVLKRIAEMVVRHKIALVLGYPEICGSDVYNAAVVFDETGQVVHTYRKLNLPSDYERSCFTRGTEVGIFEFRGIRCAVLICYDIEFPEMARSAVLNDADLLIVPTAISNKWRIVPDCVIPARAFENGVFVAYCNYAGNSTPTDFGGLSGVFQPDGQAIARAGHEPKIIFASIDTRKISEIRAQLHYLYDLKLAANRSDAQIVKLNQKQD
jgi:predicted amidohydrolase